MLVKKFAALTVVATLCLFFGAFAQGKVAVDVTAGGLKVGDMVPEVMVSGVYNYKVLGGNGGSGDAAGVGSGPDVPGSFRLSDFRGKLLILDFWASWCAPCVAMMPRLDSLQRGFGERVSIVSVGYEHASVSLPFMERVEKRRGGKRFAMPMVAGDSVLRRLFPHVVLPHYVWIGSDGRVMAVTGMDEVNAKGIAAALAGKAPGQAKRDFNLDYDLNASLMEQGLYRGQGARSYVFTGAFREGLRSRVAVGKADSILGFRFTATNTIPGTLFQAAFADKGSFTWRNTLITASDPEPLRPGDGLSEAEMEAWRRKFTVNYERWVDFGLLSGAYGLIRQDLKAWFPAISASVAKRRMRCLALVRTGAGEKFAGREGEPVLRELTGEVKVFRNVQMRHLVSPLAGFYLAGLKMPVVDATGYTGLVDVEISGSLKSVENINASLERYGLRLEEREMETEVLLIEDSIKGKGDRDE